MVVIGIDIGGTEIKAGRVKKGIITKVIKKKTKSHVSTEIFLEELFKIIDKLFHKDVKYIGIGVPGLVDEKIGVIRSLTNIPSLHNVPLKRIIEKKYDRPVFIDNDAACFVLGEKHFGKAKKYKNVVGLIMGTGAGAGVIINNKLYKGINSGAGEFGSIHYQHKKIEDYCSGKFFLWKYHITGLQLFNKITKRKRINHKALKIFNEFGENIGQELSLVVNILAPELIILGGSVANSYNFFKSEMFKTLKKEIPAAQYKRTKIKVSRRKYIAILGASVLHKEFLKK